MKALVIYDSAYGNTERVAKAIGSGIVGEVKVLRVAQASQADLPGINLLVVGSPTQAFRALKSVQTFVDKIAPGTLQGVSVAAFDTRVSPSDVGRGLRFIMKVAGYAAPRIADTLQKKGGNLVAAPEGFLVKGSEGPLAEGELERATAWAKELVK